MTFGIALSTLSQNNNDSFKFTHEKAKSSPSRSSSIHVSASAKGVAAAADLISPLEGAHGDIAPLPSDDAHRRCKCATADCARQDVRGKEGGEGETCHGAALSVTQKNRSSSACFLSLLASRAPPKAHTLVFLRRGVAVHPGVGVSRTCAARRGPWPKAQPTPTAVRPGRRPFTSDHFLQVAPIDRSDPLATAFQTCPFFRSSQEESNPSLLAVFAVSFLCLHLPEMEWTRAYVRTLNKIGRNAKRHRLSSASESESKSGNVFQRL